MILEEKIKQNKTKTTQGLNQHVPAKVSSLSILLSSALKKKNLHVALSLKYFNLYFRIQLQTVHSLFMEWL